MKINKTLVLALSLGMTPVFATAQEYLGPDAETESVAEEATDSKPLFDTDEAIRSTKKIAEKQTRVNELQVDLNIEQIESQIRTLRNEKKEQTVKEMLEERMTAALEEQKSQIEKKHEAEIAKINAQSERKIDSLEQQVKKYEDQFNNGKKGLRESIFVTKVKTGSQSLARIFADGYVTNRTIGEEIMDGVVLEDITIRGVYVSSDEGRFFMPLVSSEIAYKGTFNAKSEGDSSEGDGSREDIEEFLNSQLATPASEQGQF